MMLTQRSQVRKCLLKSKTRVYVQRNMAWSYSEKRIENMRGWSIRLNNRIHNKRGRSTSSEETPKYFGAKSALWKWMKISSVIQCWVSLLWISLCTMLWRHKGQWNRIILQTQHTRSRVRPSMYSRNSYFKWRHDIQHNDTYQST